MTKRPPREFNAREPDFLIDRMLRTAVNHLRAAYKLDLGLGTEGYSSSFLRVLAFEILLKAVCVAERGRFPASHDYAWLWDWLSPTTRENLRELALDRDPSSTAVFSAEVLSGLTAAFEHCRYDFQFAIDRTEDEHVLRGHEWVAAGAPPEAADFRTYEDELHSMIFALGTVVSEHGGLEIDDLMSIA
ncbi:MAG: hypothetical protein HLUCCA09_03120 [Rhodobacteraceae bacterium HLUCCA09]|nr:MAG: hypothetical protein HLUCCA09_03120 [Rhodobacteraceae bacterium HLUCCA09]